MRWLWFAMLASACYQPSSIVPCETDCDGSVDSVPADTTTGLCAGVPGGLMEATCFDPLPRGAVTLGGPIDTNPGSADCDVPLVDAREGVCILAAELIVIQGTVTVRGSRPLVLWSASTITIAAGAVLDVGGHQQTPGPGGNDATCPPLDGSATSAVVNPQLGSGGCGGPFGGMGGGGGIARNGPDTSAATVCIPVAQPLDRVRGGCRGGHGGISNSVGSLNGGPSGGGVYLMAREDIAVAGTIDARGAHGREASTNPNRIPGGGGGGSGGLIAFDTPKTISLENSVLNALGAGGSSGAGLSDSGGDVPGKTGSDPLLSPPTFAVGAGATVPTNTGGASGIDGAPGGGVDTTQVGGGGGGAGGVGYINAYSPGPVQVTGAKILPPLNTTF